MGRKTSISKAPEKSFKPESSSDRVDKVAKPLHSEASASRRHRTVIGAGPMNKRIPPRESPYTELTRDRAEKLATLRRGWFDEFTWAAMTGLVASLPSAVHSFMEVRVVHPFALSLPQAVDFCVVIVFLTLTVATLFSRNRGPTSMQYLEKHFGPDPDASPRRSVFPLFGKKPTTPSL
jgi:hypothetical protein